MDNTVKKRTDRAKSPMLTSLMIRLVLPHTEDSSSSSGWASIGMSWVMHIKGVPGRKTDVQDAEWIADVLQHGLIMANFVPNQEQQDMRDLTRLRVNLVQEHSCLANRVHKTLEEAGIKVSPVLSDIMGLSGRAILDSLCVGENNPQHLASCVHPNVHTTQE